MNDGLIDAFGHNAWATDEVLRVCRALSEQELSRTTPGTYGSIFATLRHLISSEANYYARLAGEEPSWDRQADDPSDLAGLAARAAELAERWRRFLATPFDAERTFAISWEAGPVRDVPAGVVLAQVLHHGDEHRTQICTVLTTIGIPTPELGVWDYAEATNRARVRET